MAGRKGEEKRIATRAFLEEKAERCRGEIVESRGRNYGRQSSYLLRGSVRSGACDYACRLCRRGLAHACF